jgi:TolB-like protein/Tfp pilus assembly protein PilF
VVTEDSVVQCITELRRAFSDTDHALIRTIARRGYRLEAKPLAGTLAPIMAETPAGRSGIRRGTWFALPLLLVAVLATAWNYVGRESSEPPPLSIVVLPFADLGGESDQIWLADGVTHDLNTDLSRLPRLFVIAHATARTFRGESLDLQQIGQELNVRYALSGSVGRRGELVRINAELISVDTGAALWAERFESPLARLAASRDEIIGRIANTLNFRLTRIENDRTLRERPADPLVSDLTTRGWALVYAGKLPANYEAARAFFQQALARDPQAVDALAGIGWTSAIMVLDGWSRAPDDDIATAAEAADKALSIDRNHVVANHVRGFLFRLERRSQSAHDAFRTVVALNPNFAAGHAQLAISELELGRPQAVRPAVEKAMRLSPRDPSLGPWLAFVGMAELHMGNDDAAILWLNRAIDTGTPVARHQAYMASALALAGRMAQAQAALATFRDARPAATIASLRASARSTIATFLTQQERLFQGLRLAGLPEI